MRRWFCHSRWFNNHFKRHIGALSITIAFMSKMQSLRGITGLVRTSSSMAWLIHQRRTIQGKIEWKQRLIVKETSEISELQIKLDAFDELIRNHEDPVDPVKIKGKAPRREQITKPGELKKFVLRQLLDAGGQPVGVTQIAIALTNHLNLELSIVNIKDVRMRVRNSLKDMAKINQATNVAASADNKPHGEGYWVLSDALLAHVDSP